MEELNKIWQHILPYLPMIVQVIIMPILIPIVKKIVGNKVDNAMDEKRIKKMHKEAYDETIGTIKNITFTQDIQPLVNSAMVDIQEKALAMLGEKLDKQDEITMQMALFWKHFMDMFDKSAMNNPAKREELQADYDRIIELVGRNKPKAIETQIIIEDGEKEKKVVENNTINMEM